MGEWMEANYLIVSESVVFFIAIFCFLTWLYLHVKKPLFKRKSFVGFLSIGLFFVLFIRAFIVEPFTIPTSSMAPTILEKDIVLVNKNYYGVRWPFLGYFSLKDMEHKLARGDIIVFKYFDVDKTSEIFYLKRVVGLPGDVVVEFNGNWYVNGVSLEEESKGQVFSDIRGGKESQNREIFSSRLDRGVFEILSSHTTAPSISFYTVPSGQIFVLGDNRGLSYDSRSFGFVPFSKILGPAEKVLLNLNGRDRSFKNLYGELE